jgi:predicted component of type VI protein secretion system
MRSGAAASCRAIFLVLPLVLLAAACSSSANLRFRCDNPINGGLLLTVDVVRATDEQARQIQSAGEKWFYDPLRDTMRERITTVTFPAKDAGGECVRDVKVPMGSKDKYIVVVADYRFQSPDASRHVVSLSREKWKGSTVRVAVKDRELIVETR